MKEAEIERDEVLELLENRGAELVQAVDGKESMNGLEHPPPARPILGGVNDSVPPVDNHWYMLRAGNARPFRGSTGAGSMAGTT